MLNASLFSTKKVCFWIIDRLIFETCSVIKQRLISLFVRRNYRQKLFIKMIWNEQSICYVIIGLLASLPTESDMLAKWNNKFLPKPTKVHHILEDFLTEWTAPKSHILLLRRFLESILNTNLKFQSQNSCLSYALQYVTAPIYCQNKSKISFAL